MTVDQLKAVFAKYTGNAEAEMLWFIALQDAETMGSLSVGELAALIFKGKKTSLADAQEWLDDNCTECLEGDEELMFDEWVDRTVRDHLEEHSIEHSTCLDD